MSGTLLWPSPDPPPIPAPGSHRIGDWTLHEALLASRLVTTIRSFANVVLFQDKLGRPPDLPPSGHGLGPRDMSFVAKRFRHVAVAIPEVRVSRGIAVSPRQ